MGKRIDLHIHTTVSDGALTPKEVIDETKHEGDPYTTEQKMLKEESYFDTTKKMSKKESYFDTSK